MDRCSPSRAECTGSATPCAQAETLLESVGESLGELPDWSTEAIVDASAARGLDGLADREDAMLVVIGSSHRATTE